MGGRSPSGGYDSGAGRRPDSGGRAEQRPAPGSGAGSRPEGGGSGEQRPGGDNASERQDARQEQQGSRQDQQDQNREDWQKYGNNQREDWQDYTDDHYEEHGGYYHGGGYYGGGYYGGDAGAVAAGVVVGAAVGAALASPPGWTMACTPTTIVAGATTYYQCGSAWYTRGYGGGNVTYVIVNPPAGY
jgi:hypothetical protein